MCEMRGGLGVEKLSSVRSSWALHCYFGCGYEQPNMDLSKDYDTVFGSSFNTLWLAMLQADLQCSREMR